MRKIIVFVVFFALSCSVGKVKKDKPLYDTRMRIYYYTESSKNEVEVCNSVMDILISFLSVDAVSDEFKDRCRMYIDISSKKNIGNKTRYTLYVNLKSLIDELKDKGIFRYDIISFAIKSDYERVNEIIHNKFSDKDGMIFLPFEKKDIADYIVDISVSSSVINTSILNIYSIEIYASIMKGTTVLDSIKATGHSSDSDPFISAIREMILKLKAVKAKLNPDFITVEFSDMKDISNFKKVSEFLKQYSESYWVLSVSKTSVVLKIPLKTSPHQLSSQILANIKDCVIENIDVENKFIKVVMNASMVGII